MNTKKSKKKTDVKVTKELASILEVATSDEGRKIIQDELDAAIIAELIATYKQSET